MIKKEEANAMGSVRVAIVGVGNCASSLVQGVEYYREADPQDRVPGLMHVTFGDYHVSDVQFVAAFDVDAKKVGMDLSEAIVASENNTIKLCDVPPTGVTVQRGPTFDVDPAVALLRDKPRFVELRAMALARVEEQRKLLAKAREGLKHWFTKLG